MSEHLSAALIATVENQINPISFLINRNIHRMKRTVMKKQQKARQETGSGLRSHQNLELSFVKECMLTNVCYLFKRSLHL